MRKMKESLPVKYDVKKLGASKAPKADGAKAKVPSGGKKMTKGKNC